MAVHPLQGSVLLPLGVDGDVTPQDSATFTINSSDTIYPRIQNFVQRTTPTPQTTGDLTGKLYASGTKISTTVTLTKVEYATSLSGSYTELTILTSDGAYNWPTNGSTSGTSFTIPVTVTETTATSLWFKITVSYT